MNKFEFIFSVLIALSGLCISIIIAFGSGRRNSYSGIYLALYLLSFSVGLAEPVIKEFFPAHQNDLWLSALGSYVFLLGPLLYLYCNELTGVRISGLRVGLHLIPFGSYLLAIIGVENSTALVEWIVYEVFVIHVMTYGMLSLRLVKRYKVDVRKLTSEIRLAFVRLFTRFSVLILLLVIVVGHLELALGRSLGALTLVIAQVIFILYACFIILLNPELSQ